MSSLTPNLGLTVDTVNDTVANTIAGIAGNWAILDNALVVPASFAAPSGVDVSDAGAASAGTATTTMRSDSVRTVLTATPTVALGAIAARGVATSLLRSDATLAVFDGTSPSLSTIGAAGATGSSNNVARRDHVHAREVGKAITSTVSVSSAEVVVVSLPVPANLLAVGMAFHIDAQGATTGAGNVTWRIRIGTAGTTSDAALVTGTATSSTAMAFLDGIVSFPTVGASGVALGGAHSFSDAANNTNTATLGSINTTVQNFITLTASISANTFVVAGAYVSQVA